MKQKKSQTKLVLIALLAILSLFLITGCNSELLSLTPEDEGVNEEPVAENVLTENSVKLIETYDSIIEDLNANIGAYEAIKLDINTKILAREDKGSLDLGTEIDAVKDLEKDAGSLENELNSLSNEVNAIKAWADSLKKSTEKLEEFVSLNKNIISEGTDAISYLKDFYDLLQADLAEYESGNFKKIDTNLYKTYKLSISLVENQMNSAKTLAGELN